MLALLLMAGPEGWRGVMAGMNAESESTMSGEAPVLEGRVTRATDQDVQASSSSAHTSPALSYKQLVKKTASVEAAAAVPEPEAGTEQSGKTVYLTFDDGPSDLTDEVLAILREHEVPATFFVLGQYAEQRPEVINRIYDEGHAIGNHTYDHRYDKLYGNFQDFWKQIKQTEEIIRLITGERPQLVRAPGGTAGHFDEMYFRLLHQAGYRVFDWNVDSGDSRRRGVPASEIVQGATTPVAGNEAIVLLHDGIGHEETVQALPHIIAYYKQHGYRFKALEPETAPVQFRVSGKLPDRPAPSQQWIKDHIAGNAALFAPGKTLAIEFGGMETAFEPGEYDNVNGSLYVPLRALVERLGGEVAWNQHSKTVQVRLGGAAWQADPLNGLLSKPGEPPVPSGVHLRGGAVWVPLRDALAFSSHPVRSLTASDTELRVIAFGTSIF
ncbi:polysaccharide deacetylase [Paenibacillus sp. 7541]|nr:polysaccharide deacetylase [Paenibacillus sp. 7541]